MTTKAKPFFHDLLDKHGYQHIVSRKSINGTDHDFEHKENPDKIVSIHEPQNGRNLTYHHIDLSKKLGEHSKKGPIESLQHSLKEEFEVFTKTLNSLLEATKIYK